MPDMIFWMPVLLGGLLAGGSCGLLSVYIVAMRIPFLGICMAHSALAGAVFGSLAGLDGQWLLVPALGCAVLTAILLGLCDPQKMAMDANVVMGLLLSLTMGLAFIGLGLFPIMGKSDNDVRSLLWGSLNFCTWSDITVMLIAAGLLAVFVFAFGKEMRAIMFSRTLAQASGVRATLVWTLFLVLAAALVTVNFQTVGGLMIYSLITNPAAAAFQLARGSRKVTILAVIFGAVSGLGGFLISAWLNLPSGAVIVLLSSLIVLVAAIFKHSTRLTRNIRFISKLQVF